MQALVAQPPHALHRVAGHQQLEHFVEHTGLGHVGQQVRMLADRLPCRRIDLEAQLGGEAHGPQHAHRVFPVAGHRIAYHANAFLLEVGHAVLVIPDLFLHRIVKQRIDGEVTPQGIIHLAAEHVVAQQAAVRIGLAVVVLALAGNLVGAEGGNLDSFRTAHDVHDLKPAANDARAAEAGAHFVGSGVGGHVVILGRPAQQQVAHRAADDKGTESRRLQFRDRAQGAGADLLLADTVPGFRNDDRPGRGFAARLAFGLAWGFRRGLVFAEYFVYQPANHGTA